MDSKINEFKNTQIPGEVTKLDPKINKNSGNILDFKTRLKQKEDILVDLQRSVQSFYGDQNYNNSWLVFEADYHTFDVSNLKYINYWRSRGIFNGTLDGITNSSSKKPAIHLAGGTVSVNFNGNYFNSQKLITTEIQWQYI